MTKTRILGLSVVALVVMNLALLAFMMTSKTPHPRHGRPELRPKREIIKRLKFDDKQVQAYEKLIETHQGQVQKKQDELMALKNTLYALLKTEDHQEADHLTREIGLRQTEIEKIHFQHFADLKALCRADQQDDFAQLTEELAELFSPRKKRKK